MKYFLVILITLLFASCSRFKVDKMNPRKVFSMKVSRKTLYFPEQNGIIHSLPQRIGVVDDWVIIPETTERRIKIYRKGTLSLILQSKARIAPAETLVVNESVKIVSDDQLNFPGAIFSGNEDDFFVINYSPSIAVPEDNSDAPREKGIYKILHYDLKGNFLGLYGRNGNISLSYPGILWVDVDSENRLWVLYRLLDDLILERNNGKSVDLSYNRKHCESLLFTEKPTGSYSYSCEVMYPFYDEDRVLFTGKVIDKENRKFLYRVIKTQSTTNSETNEIFSRLNDPEDLPYYPFDGNHIMIWQTLDNERIKWALYNLDGDLVNNKQLTYFGKRSGWRSTYYTLSGSFYSIRLLNGTLEVYNWR